MPVVEPYAISTCMATRGKINLNDQIAPFTYIHRSTALRALLDSLRIPAISAALAGTYKTSGLGNASIWNAVDEDATVAQIESRFANAGADALPQRKRNLRRASRAETHAAARYFQRRRRAGRAPRYFGTRSTSPTKTARSPATTCASCPTTQLEGRLTTRSNSYTVHVRVQILKKITTDPQQNIWKEGTDVVLGEWRGAYEIERYLDPPPPALPSPAPRSAPTISASSTSAASRRKTRNACVRGARLRYAVAMTGLEALQQLRLPDAWQAEAIRALGAGEDVIVQAPTGAGKTFIFEQFFQQRRGPGQVIYTVPTRALANDKFAEWTRQGWRVGITTRRSRLPGRCAAHRRHA